MVVLFEIARKKCIDGEVQSGSVVKKLALNPEKCQEVSPIFLCCPNRQTELKMSLKAKEDMSFIEAAKGRSGQRVGKTRPISKTGRVYFKISKF